MGSSKTDLSISRLIRAPRARVWQAWAEPRNFEKWWIPEPMTCRVIRMDLRAGGGFETQMSENGTDFTPHLNSCFLEIVPQERIVFTTVLSAGWQPVDPWLAMTAIMTMQDEDGGTRYIARALHRNPEEKRKHDEMGFYQGWGSAIDQLARLVEAVP